MISKNSKNTKNAKLTKKVPFTKMENKSITARKPLKKARPIKESNTVYLSNLSYSRDRIGVKKLVAKFGEIKNINIVIDLETKVSKGMAFVELATVEAAKAAIAELNGQDIDGRTLKANFAIPQNPLILKLKSEIDAEKAEMKQKMPTFKPRNKTKKPTESGFVPRKKSLR